MTVRKSMMRVQGLAAAVAALLLSIGAAAAPAPATAAAQRIVAVGDVHGAIDNFAAILQKAGLIDAQRQWSGGRAILVQTGDVTDRGAGMRAALDLLMSLESQARKAGGRVHAVLGNHEVMNLLGELRDANAEIFATFGGEAGMRDAFGPRGRYGRWLRSHPVIVEIDGSIFLHGGVNPAFSDASVSEINKRARREITEWDEGVRWLQQQKLVSSAPKFLEVVEAARVQIEQLIKEPLRDHPDTPKIAALLLPLANIGTSSLFSPDGPLWFRGYDSWTDAEGQAQMDLVLKQVRGTRLVTGHSVQRGGRITERFGGRLFLIDTGMLGGQYFPSGRPSALEITPQSVNRIYLD